MTDPAPRIDFANLPTPAEGILVTLFITIGVLKYARWSPRRHPTQTGRTW